MAVDRIDFVPDRFKKEAYLDIPVAIGQGLTTSQPTTIAFMLEKLKPRLNQKILEIGTGSGYLTALLAHITGPAGQIFSIEYVPELKKIAEFNLKKYRYQNIKLLAGDGKKGLVKSAPFDRIVSSAAASSVPEAWKSQIAVGGIILTPLGSRILKLIRKTETKFIEEEFPTFAFSELK